MKLFGIALDTATPWPWLGATLLAVIGATALRATWPRIAAAWSAAGEEQHAGA